MKAPKFDPESFVFDSINLPTSFIIIFIPVSIFLFYEKVFPALILNPRINTLTNIYTFMMSLFPFLNKFSFLISYYNYYYCFVYMYDVCVHKESMYVEVREQLCRVSFLLWVSGTKIKSQACMTCTFSLLSYLIVS